MKAHAVERFHAELVDALHSRTGLRHELAAPFVDAIVAHLQERYSGEMIYIPGRVRAYQLDVMRREIMAGDSYRKVAKRHGLEHRKLYRLLPRKSLASTAIEAQP